MGKKLFQEAIEKTGYNQLNRLAQHLNASPIYSSLDEDAYYLFGVQPRYFEEKDSSAAYRASQDNVEAHNKFIEECINTLKATDIFSILEQLEVKSPEVVAMKRLHLEKEKNWNKEIEERNTTIARLERENINISLCCEVDLETFQDTIKNHEYCKRELEHYKHELRKSKEKIQSLTSQLDRINEQENTAMESLRSNRLALEVELNEWRERYMVLKGKKDKDKEKEKEKEKKRREKEKKKLKELKKKLESDSDSDSDSD